METFRVEHKSPSKFPPKTHLFNKIADSSSGTPGTTNEAKKSLTRHHSNYNDSKGSKSKISINEDLNYIMMSN